MSSASAEPNVPLKMCLLAARMDVGGMFKSEGKPAAIAIMMGILQELKAQGAISEWRAVAVEEGDMKVEIYIAPARGYSVKIPIASLTPDNELAIEVMCS